MNPPPTSCTTVVALLCGLPASGKSSLARWLVAHFDEDEQVSVVHIEYDQVEDGLLEEASRAGQQEKDESSYGREIWKQSRTKSLDLFQTTLSDTTNPSATRIILVDDNFHLRSMRREIYRLCQEHVQEHDKLYLTVLWMDTPVEICRERNQKRSRQVPNPVVDRMSTTLEPPGKEHWEQSHLQIKDLPPLLGEETCCPILQTIKDYLTKDCSQNYDPVPPPPPPVDLEQLEEERRKTRESWLHTWDQRLRKWVGQVAQISRKDTGQANKARKTLLAKLRQEQGEELPTAQQIVDRFLDEMKVEWTESQLAEFRKAAVHDDNP